MYIINIEQVFRNCAPHICLYNQHPPLEVAQAHWKQNIARIAKCFIIVTLNCQVGEGIIRDFFFVKS